MNISKCVLQRDSGFTLVELSIVLVILGLLVGGVLTGQSLIRAAELRSVTAQFSGFQTAIYAFRDKYFALPGDMTNATSFWGAAHATAATCLSTVGTSTQTCNGNGNNILDVGVTAGQRNECFMVWQHLANAGLIEGNYNGMSGSGNGMNSTTANSPRGKLGNALWLFFNWNQAWSGNATVFDGVYTDNLLQVGGATAASTPTTPLFKPEEAWNMDKKLDDGKPGYGKMRERMWGTCTTAASSANIDADYLLSGTTATCVPIFIVK